MKIFRTSLLSIGILLSMASRRRSDICSALKKSVLQLLLRQSGISFDELQQRGEYNVSITLAVLLGHWYDAWKTVSPVWSWVSPGNSHRECTVRLCSDIMMPFTLESLLELLPPFVPKGEVHPSPVVVLGYRCGAALQFCRDFSASFLAFLPACRYPLPLWLCGKSL